VERYLFNLRSRIKKLRIVIALERIFLEEEKDSSSSWDFLRYCSAALSLFRLRILTHIEQTYLYLR